MLKKLLLPTDFSPNAENATQFAIKLANLFQSQLFLLHSYHGGSKRADIFKDLEGIIRKEAEDNMTRALEKVNAKLEGAAAATGKVIEGRPSTNAATFAEKEGCDLIIMGTQGATGALDVFLGSTTGNVLKYTTVPVLAIPADCECKPFTNIVLALDSDPLPSRKVFAPLYQIASRLKSNIHLFHLRTDADQGLDRSIQSYLEGLELSYHETAGGNNVYESTNEFVSSTGSELLCMIRRQKGYFERLFLGSATLRQVYQSPVPLLVLIGDGGGEE